MAYTTIDDPEAYFQVKTYTGTGSSNALTLDGDTDMQPDMVWIKSRSHARIHTLTDAVRGVTEEIYPDITDAEDTQAEGLTAFGSDGFTVGTHINYNNDTYTYVAWCWKESATAGFDIVTYTGNGSTRTVSHSLSAVPKMIICKSRGNTDGSTDAARNWNIYHAGIASDAETDVIMLDLNNAVSDDNAPWNDTAPTSSVWSMGNHDGTNLSDLTYVAYLFAEKQGFSKFGSYVGNGSTDGTFVYTGFRPAFVLGKRTDSSSSGAWVLWDNKRNPFNASENYLVVDSAGAEGSSGTSIDMLSNGFKPYDAGACNISGGTFIYMAFAEAPFVNSNGVPCNAR